MQTLLTIAGCLALPVVWGLVVGKIFDRIERASETPREPPEYSI
ncbi:MAG: hypothetical protein AAF532_06470 [Planctomycetota bacterium]